ncbi:MAG: hypothetical protein RB191_19960 [Terriglobia bacterium]|nr:hypothetical protein [Terriglobia bacterium]
MTAIDLFIARERQEEGERNDPYDDATGKTVTAPIGNLTWGRGYNLSEIASPELFDVIDRYLVGHIEAQLMPYAWYQIDAPRQSVLLDIAYNAGVVGLLHYVRMLAAIASHDWTEAARQCTSSNPKLHGRYEALSRILVTGDA